MIIRVFDGWVVAAGIQGIAIYQGKKKRLLSVVPNSMGKSYHFIHISCNLVVLSASMVSIYKTAYSSGSEISLMQK